MTIASSLMKLVKPGVRMNASSASTTLKKSYSGVFGAMQRLEKAGKLQSEQVGKALVFFRPERKPAEKSEAKPVRRVMTMAPVERRKLLLRQATMIGQLTAVIDEWTFHSKEAATAEMHKAEMERLDSIKNVLQSQLAEIRQQLG